MKLNLSIGVDLMLLSLAELKDIDWIDKVVIHSVDQSLYQASVICGNKEYFVKDSNNKLLRSFRLPELQERFRGLMFGQMVLRHTSPYDEMIGQGDKVRDQNAMEVPLNLGEVLPFKAPYAG